jgi:hypothetical protein
MARRFRLLTIALVVLALLVGGAFAAYHFALKTLRQQIVQALGPLSEIGEIKVGLAAVEITGLRIRAPEGGSPRDRWPAAEQLRAERIVVAPDLRALLSKEIRVDSIRIENGYLSMLRSRDGKMRVVPSLLEKPAVGKDGEAPLPNIAIGRIELAGSVIEFFDATIAQPPHRLRLEQLAASFGPLQLPDLAGRADLALAGVVKGVQRDGTVEVKGGIEIASKDSEIALNLRGVDLVALQPYLIKAAESGVRKGAIDLDLKSTVKKKRLHAPGKLTIKGLELSESGGRSFMGMSRGAVVSMMKSRNGEIGVNFTLAGNLDDPKFSLNESFAARVGASFADTLGVSFEGLAKGVGSAGRGIGEAVGKLFGK